MPVVFGDYTYSLTLGEPLTVDELRYLSMIPLLLAILWIFLSLYLIYESYIVKRLLSLPLGSNCQAFQVQEFPCCQSIPHL